MAQYPSDVKYMKSHEWVRVKDGVATVGISDYAQESLTDVVFVELPDAGKKVKKGETFGVVESIKSVSDLYAPVSGEIVEVNPALGDAPELVNDSPFDKGWMIKIRIDDETELGSLLDAKAYQAEAEGGD